MQDPSKLHGVLVSEVMLDALRNVEKGACRGDDFLALGEKPHFAFQDVKGLFFAGLNVQRSPGRIVVTRRFSIEVSGLEIEYFLYYCCIDSYKIRHPFPGCKSPEWLKPRVVIGCLEVIR